MNNPNWGRTWSEVLLQQNFESVAARNEIYIISCVSGRPGDAGLRSSTTFISSGQTASCMGTLLANVAIVVVLALFGAALFAMTIEDYALAGVLFLSASIVIYYRENRLVAD